MLYIVKTIFKIFLIFSVFYFAPASLYAEKIGYQVIVKSPKLNMRSVPKRGARVVAVLTKGNKAEAVGSIDLKWVKVIYQGKAGFLRNRPVYIKIVPKKILKNHDIKKAKLNIKKKIREQKKDIKKYRKQAKNIAVGLDAIDRAINNAARRLVGLRKEYFDIGVKLSSIEKNISVINKKIRKMQPFVMKRVRALYKFNLIGEANLLLSAENVADFLKREKALKRIVSSDLKMIEDYFQARQKEISLNAELEKEQKRIESFQEKISKYLRIKESEKDKKKRLLREIREKEEIKLALIESLKESAKELDKKIDRFNEESDGGESFSFRNFKSYKRLLNPPVKGKIISFFGEKTGGKGFYSYKRGIDIRSDLGEPVHSIFDGTVVFADWLQGYGNMIIIRHMGSYYSIYAHVQEFFKQKGDSVKKDEVIATIGEAGLMSEPVLYFEIRHHGDPVDPGKWIKMR